MDDPLRIIASAHGVFLTREALEAGYDDQAITRHRRQLIWHRVRHGAYCFVDAWAEMTPEQRHLTLARAVLRTTPGPLALSHTTALIAAGIATWGIDMRRVHVTRLDNGTGRALTDATHHVGHSSLDDLVEIDGLLVMKPARAVLEAGTILTAEAALVSADNALHRQLCSIDDLHDTFESLNHWQGSQKMHVVLHHTDGRAASPGESRARYHFWRQGLPTPDLQVEVRDETGEIIAITDFGWRDERLFGEFDGKAKYSRYLRPGESPGDAVFREKRREDRVRAITGYAFARVFWDDLNQPARMADHIRSLMRRAA